MSSDLLRELRAHFRRELLPPAKLRAWWAFLDRCVAEGVITSAQRDAWANRP